MKKENIIGFFLSLNIPSGSDEKEEEYYEGLGQEFAGYIWSPSGLANRLKTLEYQAFGKDIKLILFELNVFADQGKRAVLKDIDYRQREKAVGLPIFIDKNNFFDKSESARLEFLKKEILDKMNLMSDLVKSKNLDTKIEDLTAGIKEILNS